METHQEFAENHAPYFGDIVFSREPSFVSKSIRKAQNFPRRKATSRAGDNYSHVAFVLDCNKLIHATKGGGVDFVALKTFFETSGIQFTVLRNPEARFDRMEIGKGAYYHGQGYDLDFFSRFVANKPKLGRQVCSTLAASMLNNFELAKIETPDRISPNDLLAVLKQAKWSDVTSRYLKWTYILKGNEGLIVDLVENEERNIETIHRSARNQQHVASLLSKVFETQLDIVRKNNLGKELEKQILDEVKNLDELEDRIYKFHDTDDFT